MSDPYLAIFCPACRAQIDEPCRTPGGKLAVGPHMQRRELADRCKLTPVATPTVERAYNGSLKCKCGSTKFEVRLKVAVYPTLAQSATVTGLACSECDTPMKIQWDTPWFLFTSNPGASFS